MVGERGEDQGPDKLPTEGRLRPGVKIMKKYVAGSLGEAQRLKAIFDGQVSDVLLVVCAKAEAVRQAWQNAESEDDLAVDPRSAAIVLSQSRPSLVAAGGPTVQTRWAGSLSLEYSDFLIGYADEEIRRTAVRKALVAVVGFDPARRLAWVKRRLKKV